MNNAKQGGSFINISSITGLDQSLFPGAVAYGTSKYLALQLGPLNIQVNAIAAGVYETETTVDLFCEWMDRVGENRVPLKKWGHRDPNLTCVVLFLSTEASLIPSKHSSITPVEKVTEYQNLVQ
jgi:NAD(P)-dependent dehydrogenase (short-subunit alcohol dehydrogenase family)